MNPRPPPAEGLRQVPPVLWAAGGCLGVAYMVTNVALVPRLGVAPVLSLAVAGQMLAALLVDRFGLLGVAERAVTPLHALDAAFLVAGVALIVRR